MSSNEVSSTNTPSRKRQRKDLSIDEYPHILFSDENNPSGPVWKYFLSNKEYKDKAKCKLCLEEGIHKYVSRSGRSTSSLLAHLQSDKHKEISKNI